MTKTKKQSYLLVISLLFLNLFFLQVSGAKADDCSDCLSAYNGESFYCIDYCDYAPSQDSSAGFDWNAECQSQFGSQSWYDGFDCQDKNSPETACQMDGGRWTDGACSYTIATYSYDECLADGGDVDYCKQFGGGASNATLEDMSAGFCSTNSDCGGGFTCYNSSCVDNVTYQQFMSDGTCSKDSDCGNGFVCYQGSCLDDETYSDTTSFLDKVGNYFDGNGNSDNTPLTSAQLAALKAAAATSKANAVTSMNSLNNATKNKAAADAAVSNCGTDAAACQKAREAAAAANAALIQAQADFDEKIAQANADAVSAGASTNKGAGFSICSIGICTNGQGTPIVLGAADGIIPGGGFGGSGGFNGVATPKCGTNFSEIGGVCFPTNTGLSNAPIYVILSNLFSWLMGLFTTLAVVAFVISGLQYLTAAGDSKRMEDGKNNATYAVIGIIVGLSGFIIIKAIAAALSGQGYFF